MALPTTGPISLGQVRTELKKTGTISLGNVDVRNLANKNSGVIKMSDLRGKTFMYKTTAANSGYKYFEGSTPIITFPIEINADVFTTINVGINSNHAARYSYDYSGTSKCDNWQSVGSIKTPVNNNYTDSSDSGGTPGDPVAAIYPVITNVSSLSGAEAYFSKSINSITTTDTIVWEKQLYSSYNLRVQILIRKAGNIVTVTLRYIWGVPTGNNRQKTRLKYNAKAGIILT